MRIRKPFTAVKSRNPSEMAGGFPCVGDGDNDEDAKEEFLRPLVEAVLDVQAKARSKSAEDATPTPSPAPEIPEIAAAVHRRPVHNWRKGLPGPDADSKEIKVSREGDKSNCGNEIIRNRGGKIQRHASQGIYLFENDNLKKKNKAQYKDKKSNNQHGGSQCTRRNGRGWRCSQRTLVGYSLCEHHLGNARLRSVSGNGPVAAKNKGIKFKELELIRAAFSKVEPETLEDRPIKVASSITGITL